MVFYIIFKKNSKYEQEIPQSHTADQATPIKVIATLEGHKVLNNKM